MLSLKFAIDISLVLGILTEGLAEGWLEGASILIAVVIIVTVTSGNNYIKEQQFQRLNAIATAKDIHVYRGGDLIKMSVYELLVGDIVQISTGEIFSFLHNFEKVKHLFEYHFRFMDCIFR